MTTKMIDPSMFDSTLLMQQLLGDPQRVEGWRHRAEIIPDYMPPYPRKDTKPTCQVQFAGAFLRYANGASRMLFWDIYGSDFVYPELALITLIAAPVPYTLLQKRPTE